MRKTNVGLWLLCTSLACAVSPDLAFSQKPKQSPSSSSVEVPPEYREPYRSALQGKPFAFDEKNMLFMSGVASVLLKKCNLPRDRRERTTLAWFVKSGENLAALGNQYSHPDIGKAAGNVISSQLTYQAGVQAAQGVECSAAETKQLASGIVKAVESNTQSADGGASPFVKGCAPSFSEAKCQCLANLGRAAFPNIHQMTYSRDIFPAITKRSPLVGFQIVTICGIVRY
jgi:hypothetical protein